MITERDLQILLAVAHYYVLSRPQIQTLCCPTDKTGRVTRRRLQRLVAERLLNRHRAQVVYPNSAPAGSVYYPSRKGCELLAETVGEDQYLLTPTQCPQPHHVQHWLAVSDTHIKLDAAIAPQEAVELRGFVNEWDVVNKEEQEPQKHFRLYTLLSANPKLVCAPDAAFLLSAAGFSKVFYIEQDRATSGTKQVAARKIKGYSVLANRGGQAAHFPETNVESFTVLCIASTARRRDALKRAFSGLEGAKLWKFCSAEELTCETFLFVPIWYGTSGEPVPLVKLPSSSEGQL